MTTTAPTVRVPDVPCGGAHNIDDWMTKRIRIRGVPWQGARGWLRQLDPGAYWLGGRVEELPSIWCGSACCSY